MRKLILMPVAALIALAFGPIVDQVNPALAEKAVQRQVGVAAKREAPPEGFPEKLTGEVVSADYGARRMTVKQSGSFTSEEITFAVVEPVAPMLGELQPGDRVTVGYVREHGHLIAMAIRKVPAEHGT